ncbi:flagellar protein FlgN [Erythrobacter sp. SCSIO 43205]|nr:flagellar protein FlgN [Erythrobacter sp. SCSIO 43205]
MIAVLQDERQALATLKAQTLFDVTREKEGLCEQLAQFSALSMDDETRALAQTAKSLNDVNRRVRNLLAANVAGRLEALGGQRHAYSATSLPGPAPA